MKRLLHAVLFSVIALAGCDEFTRAEQGSPDPLPDMDRHIADEVESRLDALETQARSNTDAAGD